MQRGRMEPKKDETKLNRQITADPVRVIGLEGEAIGVISLREALSLAQEAGVDLVEISPKAEPPVCKIVDYGKYKFQTQKKAAEARKKQTVVSVKELVLRPGTDEHDYMVKIRHAREFVEKGHKVKFTLRFRGREITHQEIGMAMLSKAETDLQDLAKVDSRPRMEGRVMVMMMSPVKK